MTPSAAGSKAPSPTYRPDIDGLRALAVLPVLLFHAKLGCPGGFVGVDIFFVISGFLICSLILREFEEGNFSLVTFWERRIRRILPALTVVVLVTLVAGWFLYLPEDFESVGKSGVAQALLVSNVFFWQQEGYFSPGSDTKPLLHLWSLAVEEQFYLLFPLLLIFLARYKGFSLSKIMASLAVGSFAFSVMGSYSNPEATFYLLPTRAWELMAGTLLAMLRGRLSIRPLWREAGGWLGLGLVCYSILFYNRETRFPGLAALPPCLGAFLIIASSEAKRSLVGRILAFKPVVAVGLISYSLYLWHWPVLVFSKYLSKYGQSARLRVVLLAASIGLAILTWKYVETPFRKRQILPRRSQVFGFAGVSMSALLILGFFVEQRHGFPSRFPEKALRYANSRYRRAFLTDTSLEQAVAGKFEEIGSQEASQPISLLIWGDSHARSLTPALDELCRKFSQRGVQATHSLTAPVLEYNSTSSWSLKEDSPAFANAVLAFVTQRRVQNVIIAAEWCSYPASDSLKAKLLATVRAFLDSGARVYVVKDVPISTFDVPRLVSSTARYGGDVQKLGVTRERHEMLNREFQQTFATISQMGATVLDPADYFLNRDGFYEVVRNEQVLYFDSDHLTLEGSSLLKPLFEPIFHAEWQRGL